MAIKELPQYKSKVDNYIYVDDVSEFVTGVLSNKPKRIAVDTETFFDEEKAKQIGVITKWIKDAPNNIPFGVSLYWDGKGYWIDHDIQKLQPLLQDEDIDKVFHNSKYDINMLRNINIEVKGFIWDTMIMINLIDEEFMCKLPPDENGEVLFKKSKALKNLAYHFLNADAHEYEDLVNEYRTIIAQNTGRKKDEVSYLEVSQANHDLMKDYAIADTEFTYKLFDIFLPMLHEQDLIKAYNIDINATFAVVEMERVGYRIDIAAAQHDREILSGIIEDRLNNIFRIAGYEFNPNSDKELVDAFGSIGQSWHWFTDKQEYSTDKTVLKLLYNAYEENIRDMAQAVLEYRKATKILTVYIDGILKYVQADGKVHPDFWISPNDQGKHATKTGRLSSSYPNFQNIPKKPLEIALKFKGEEKAIINVRNYFIADEGCVAVHMDYDQQEYRLLGHYGQDTAFMQFIHDGKDIHIATGSLVYGVPYEEVTDDQRSMGKTTNFGVVYGLGNPAFAKACGYDLDEDKLRKGTRWLYKNYRPWKLPPYDKSVTLHHVLTNFKETSEEAEAILGGIEYFFSAEVQEAIEFASKTKKEYFARFPGIKSFIDECSKVASRRGYVRYWTGRRRHFKNPKEEGYKAPNAVIQGGCAEIMKIKLWEVLQFIWANNLKTKVINSVHDEACFLVPYDELDYIPQFREIMQDLPFRVPITCGVDWSIRWGSKVAYESVEKIKENVKGNLNV